MDLKTEQIEFEISNVQGSGLEIGNNKSTLVALADETTIAEQYRDCVIALNELDLEVATWNIRTFPQSSNTIATLVEVISNLDVDVIAVQEIRNRDQFLSLGSQLNGYEAVVEDVSGDIELGFLYRSSAITSFGTIRKLFPGDSFGYPREAIEVDITHANGIQAKLINIHLKCCSDGEERRADASRTMKSYLDGQHASGNVIVLGDFNDDLLQGSPFSNFISDNTDYFFADQEIARGPSSEWSFPGFPSHIDHILCTNDLSESFVLAKTYTLDDCIGNYNGIVSDHLPVVAVFKN